MWQLMFSMPVMCTMWRRLHIVHITGIINICCHITTIKIFKYFKFFNISNINKEINKNSLKMIL